MTEQLQDGRVLATWSSQQGEHIVFENKLFRWLCFDDKQAIQSCMLQAKPEKLILPYQQLMMMWQLFRPETRSVSSSLLGMGGGDIIRYLRNKFPLMNIVAVDNDPQIAKIASEYFFIKPDQDKLILQIEDAQEFIKKPQRHDLLLIDIVENNVLPKFLSKISFWQDCRASLNENGIVVVNFIPESESHFLNILKMLKDIFGYLPLCMEVPGHKNIVLFMLLELDDMPNLSELQRRGVMLQEGSELPFQECVEILAKDNVGVFG